MLSACEFLSFHTSSYGVYLLFSTRLLYDIAYFRSAPTHTHKSNHTVQPSAQEQSDSNQTVQPSAQKNNQTARSQYTRALESNHTVQLERSAVQSERSDVIRQQSSST